MKKFVLLTLALALFASVFVCAGAYAQTVRPWDTDITVRLGEDEFRYVLSEKMAPFAHQAQERGFYLGAQAKRKLADRLLGMGLCPQEVYNYILPDFDGILRHFGYVNAQRRDAELSFGPDGFAYRSGQDGVAIDADRLFELLLGGNGRPATVQLPLTVDRAVTTDQLRQNTVCRGTFETSFVSSGANRCHNIAQAAAALNGVTVGVGETFSFNRTVGERTEQRGYKTGKIIVDGAYTDGVGGGVCQVSTTLYNALLVAGFVPKAVQHSLVSSYVQAGFDAMVSYGSADLTFVNDTDHPIYISAAVKGKKLRFSVYGQPNPYTIERESVQQRDKFATVYIVDSDKYPDLVYTDQTKVVVGGSDGVKCKSYLKYYQNGKLVRTQLIRNCSYKRVDAVVARGYLPRPEQ